MLVACPTVSKLHNKSNITGFLTLLPLNSCEGVRSLVVTSSGEVCVSLSGFPKRLNNLGGNLVVDLASIIMYDYKFWVKCFVAQLIGINRAMVATNDCTL